MHYERKRSTGISWKGDQGGHGATAQGDSRENRAHDRGLDEHCWRRCYSNLDSDEGHPSEGYERRAHRRRVQCVRVNRPVWHCNWRAWLLLPDQLVTDFSLAPVQCKAPLTDCGRRLPLNLILYIFLFKNSLFESNHKKTIP